MISEETRAKLSAAQMGNTNRNGKKASVETRLRMKRAHRDRPPASEGTRAKMSAAHRGHQRNLGRKASEETRRKMSEAKKAYWQRRKAVAC